MLFVLSPSWQGFEFRTRRRRPPPDFRLGAAVTGYIKRRLVGTAPSIAQPCGGTKAFLAQERLRVLGLETLSRTCLHMTSAVSRVTLALYDG